MKPGKLEKNQAPTGFNCYHGCSIEEIKWPVAEGRGLISGKGSFYRAFTKSDVQTFHRKRRNEGGTGDRLHELL